MRPRPIAARERGAALLAVLLLVAVTGAIAAAAMESLSLSRAAATNSVALDQARFHAAGIEQLALVTIDDLIAANPERTLAGPWNGAVRQVVLPGGGVARLRLRDGGNCLNVNSVVEGDPRTRLTRRGSGVMQLAGLMRVLGVADGEARRIAEAAADWADSDSDPGPGGAEDGAYASARPPYRTGNTLFADVGELGALAGMTPEILARLRPFLCALPVAELSPLNINSLRPDQAPLLAMLAPDRLRAEQARRILAARPARGWGSQVEFWRIDALNDLDVPLDVQLQLQMRTYWFALETRVEIMESAFSETALVDARLQPSRLVARQWGE